MQMPRAGDGGASIQCGGRASQGRGIVELLKECSRSRNLEKGQRIHHQAAEQGLLPNIYVFNTLIHMYASCGSMLEARRVFDSGVVKPNSVAWTCMIRGYVENHQCELALETFDRMDSAPNARTFVAALSACAKLDEFKWLEKGREIHSRAVRNRCCNLFVESILVDMYSKFGCMDEARLVFDNMSTVPWNALLQGYVDNGESELALKLFDTMKLARTSLRETKT